MGSLREKGRASRYLSSMFINNPLSRDGSNKEGGLKTKERRRRRKKTKGGSPTWDERGKNPRSGLMCQCAPQWAP
jgi:hypothetical protein